jgi:hypothetical protein
MVFYVALGSVQLAIGMLEKQAGRLRLGLLLLMAAAMVKFEGMLLLALWTVLLLLDRDSRSAIWPPRHVGWAGLFAFAAWLPYVVFRLHGPVPHAESAWLSLFLKHTEAVFHMLPMTWVAMLSPRFLHNDFALWGAPGNQHAVWQGHWMGWQSLVDQWTQGAGWVCVLLWGVAWYRGGRLRWTAFRLFLVFFVFATTISVVWSAVSSSPMDYDHALTGGVSSFGGRYLYPAFMAWFAGGSILLLRTLPGEPADSNDKERTGRIDQPTARQMT